MVRSREFSRRCIDGRAERLGELSPGPSRPSARRSCAAGLDPISSRLLDDLILQLRDSLGATLVVVSHELASIFAIGNNSVFLDADSRTMIASGNPRDLLAHSTNPTVRRFLTRGGQGEESAGSHG